MRMHGSVLACLAAIIAACGAKEADDGGGSDGAATADVGAAGEGGEVRDAGAEDGGGGDAAVRTDADGPELPDAEPRSDAAGDGAASDAAVGDAASSDAATDTDATDAGPPSMHPCDQAVDLAARAPREEDGWHRLQDRTADGESMLEGACGAPGGERVYRFDAPAAGAVRYGFESAAGVVMYARTDCRDAATERHCDAVGSGGERIVSAEAGGAVYFVVDAAPEAARATFNLGVKFTPYVELGERCHFDQEEDRCRPEADCSPSRVCRSVVRNYPPDDCGFGDISPLAGEEGHWTASRVTPPAWPFQVTGLRFSYQPACNRPAPFRVQVYTTTEVAPPASPDVLMEVALPGRESLLTLPSHVAFEVIELSLDPPVILRDGEDLVFAMEMTGVAPDVNAISWCFMRQHAAEVDRFYWSNATDPPYRWATLASFGLDGEVPIDLFGAAFEGDPPAPPAREATPCERACERVAACDLSDLCVCLDQTPAWLTDVCVQVCDDALGATLLEAPTCQAALDVMSVASARIRRACSGAAPDCSSPRFTQLDAGGAHTCGLLADGQVLCWGAEDVRRFNPQSIHIPAWAQSVQFGQAASVEGVFTQVSAGGYHTCGLRADGTVNCWGGAFEFVSRPAPEVAMARISAGDRDTCGLTPGGEAVCWGGVDTFDRPTPVPPGPFVDVSAGNSNACALRADQTVTCWPNSPDNFSKLPSPEDSFVQLSATTTGSAFDFAGHGCGVTIDGDAACWHADNAQDGGFMDFGQWRPPEGPFTQVTVGMRHSCGLRPNGSAECWGLGHPTPPEGPFTSISAGYHHTCALRPDGTAVCWGNNRYGQASPPGQ